MAQFVYGSKPHVPDYLIRYGTSAGVYRIISDHLGSPRIVVDLTTGAVAQRLDYDEFGNVSLDTSPGFQPFGFAGGLYDRDTGLTRFGTRDYDSVTGRWVAKDPTIFNGAELNLYVYTGGDAINAIDVDGLLTLHLFTDKNLEKEVEKLPDELDGIKPDLEKAAKCADEVIHHDLGGPDGDLILKPNVNIKKPSAEITIEYKW